MAQAILEVNHWCHEKATYTATDPRTASPLTVVRSARGPLRRRIGASGGSPAQFMFARPPSVYSALVPHRF